MVHELVKVQFRRRAQLVGGAMYLPGEVALVRQEEAADLFADLDNPAATLIASLDTPPKHKMVVQPESKKGKHG